tara:strand:+ start:613 stop:873 length:261 start_codon:yes stop_codon:yes gene_type:complete
MIPNRGQIRPHHAKYAAESLAKALTPTNATKFQHVVGSTPVDPKKIVALSHYLATGVALPVSRFSGGVETNLFLSKRGIKVELING